MNFLAISGSARAASTNTAMLRALQEAAKSTYVLSVYDRIGELPIFSPDLELPEPPLKRFMESVDAVTTAAAGSAPEAPPPAAQMPLVIAGPDGAGKTKSWPRSLATIPLVPHL